MSESFYQLLIVLGVPFLAMTICWVALMVAMHKTTGELKVFLTPDNLVKAISIVFIVSGTLALAMTKVIGGDVAGTILAGVIGYTLGTGFGRNL